MAAHNIIRRLFLASGQVQGVGFRPFVYGLARSCCLTGSVGNTSDGVHIEVQGKAEAVADFGLRLREELPPLARLAELAEAELPLVPGEQAFSIAQSSGHAGHTVLVSPDVALCADCAAEMRDPANRRYGYAFTNCVNCGPRYTITRAIPYDRSSTSMACFALCPACAAEYADPADRRFHAQPTACPVCGPRLWLVRRGEDGRPTEKNSRQALAQAAKIIRAGGIVALKGLGGFQLACDAYNLAAVRELRRRKERPHKPLALMAADMDAVRRICAPEPEHEALLLSPEKPIVLCPRRSAINPAVRPGPGRDLPEDIAPDMHSVGLMLPPTPLHVMLLAHLNAAEQTGVSVESQAPAVLVMTSANAAGEPICLGNREAQERLADLADAFLLHDRDILTRVDDSVVAVQGRAQKQTLKQAPEHILERASEQASGQVSGQVSGQASEQEPKAEQARPAPLFFRRARGYVPRPVSLKAFAVPRTAPTVFAAGADLKNTFCLTRGDEAFVSQHIGDLENPAAVAFHQEAAAHLEALLEVRPAAFICDAHPDFFSARSARARAQSLSLPCLTLQHHAAHAAAVAAENHCLEPMLALCLDGTGWGTDGSIWGGELLYLELAAPRWERLGGLSTFALPGGDAATREPWRIALALRGHSAEPALAQAPAWEVLAPAALRAVTEMLQRNVHCPRTSSCGRLFDAIAAQLGLCLCISYEGQAAVRLESAATPEMPAALRSPPAAPGITKSDANGLLLLDSAALFEAVLKDQADGASIGQAAARFHLRLARGLTELAATAAGRLGIAKVGLTGGVMQNGLLARLLPEYLREAGLEPLVHHELPAGDGGLSLGQAVWGRQLLRN